jgi:hypothetical protein
MLSDASDEQSDIALRYSHHVIEHLGLKLYQNRPGNVLAELVSNSWDALAKRVWIDLQTELDRGDGRYISVADDGQGMSLEDVRDSYLVIGKLKDRTNAHQRARFPTGRKGIGKLAPFGIARVLDLVTITNQGERREATWIRLKLEDILKRSGAEDPVKQSVYPPKVLAKGVEVGTIDLSQDSTGQVERFLQRIGGGTGTLVLLTDLSLLKSLSADAIQAAMGRRFTVTLTRPDFVVSVNDVPITEAQALPVFEHRIPESGTITETLGSRKITYWVGFVEKADWPQDEAGVGVYAHGKIAQDRPFTFGLKGREIFTRYMYGVVEADWLDELPQDVVSTDRTSVDWDQPDAAQLYEWGQGKVRQWVEAFRKSRITGERSKVGARVRTGILSGELPKVSEDEQRIIADLLSEVTPGLGKDEEATGKVTAAVMKAYLHRPMREMLKQLWDKFADLPDGSAAFLETIDALGRQAIPEALSLAVVFAQRAYALTMLYEMQHKGTEPDLQKLIEKFPWILQPEMERLTANQRLKTVVEEAVKLGHSPSRFVPGQVDVNEKYKPDFVFLSDAETTDIVVVEIKTPREDLTFRNREQLAAYMVYLEQQYPKAKRMGYLVGSNSQDMQPGRYDIKILAWEEIFRASRRGHVELLAAMLAFAGPDADDDRVKQVFEFGGAATWDLLGRLATNDEDLTILLAAAVTSPGSAPPITDAAIAPLPKNNNP